MHERHRTERRFAPRPTGQCQIRPMAERHAPRRRELHEQIVRMLTIGDL